MIRAGFKIFARARARVKPSPKLHCFKNLVCKTQKLERHSPIQFCVFPMEVAEQSNLV